MRTLFRASLTGAFLMIVNLLAAYTASAEDTAVSRDSYALSQFDIFPQEATDQEKGIKTTAKWEVELNNEDAYDFRNFSIFKFGDIIYLYGFHYTSPKNKLHFRRFNAITGAPIADTKGEFLSEIQLPTDNRTVIGPYEAWSKLLDTTTGSWLRFFTDFDGNIGLCSFIRDEALTGSRNSMRISVFKVDIEQSFVDGVLALTLVSTHDYSGIFDGCENFVSNLFDVSGSLSDNTLEFQYLILSDDANVKGRTGHKIFHFNLSSNINSEYALTIKDGVVLKHGYDPRSIYPISENDYIVNSPLNGASIMSEADNGGSYEVTSMWTQSASETDSDSNLNAGESVKVKNYCFFPIKLADDDYYLTTGDSITTTASNNCSGSIGFQLWRWNGDREFENLEKVIKLPSKSFDFNSAKYINTYSQQCLVEYEVSPDATEESRQSSKTIRNQSAVKSENWRKTICYLYSPSAGIARYDFEPTYRGWITELDELNATNTIHQSGNKIRIDGDAADLTIYNAAGIIIESRPHCNEISLDSHPAGYYILQWGASVAKVIIR